MGCYYNTDYNVKPVVFHENSYILLVFELRTYVFLDDNAMFTAVNFSKTRHRSLTDNRKTSKNFLVKVKLN